MRMAIGKRQVEMKRAKPVPPRSGKIDVRPWSGAAPVRSCLFISLFVYQRTRAAKNKGRSDRGIDQNGQGQKREGMRLPVEGCCHPVLSPFSPTFVFVGPGPPSSSCNLTWLSEGGRRDLGKTRPQGGKQPKPTQHPKSPKKSAICGV